MTQSSSATVKGGYWGDSVGMTTLTPISGKGYARRMAATLLASKGTAAMRHTLRTLDGAAPGATSLKQYPTIDASSELGGKRGVTNNNLINRATTSTDVTETLADVLSLYTRTTFGASPVANKDGNPLGTR